MQNISEINNDLSAEPVIFLIFLNNLRKTLCNMIISARKTHIVILQIIRTFKILTHRYNDV